MNKEDVTSEKQEIEECKGKWEAPVLNKKDIKETLAIATTGDEGQGRPRS